MHKPLQMIVVTQCPFIRHRWIYFDANAQMEKMWHRNATSTLQVIWSVPQCTILMQVQHCRWFYDYLQIQQLIIPKWQSHRYLNQQIAEMKQFWDVNFLKQIPRICIQLWRETITWRYSLSTSNISKFQSIMRNLTHQAFIFKFFFHSLKRNRCVVLGSPGFWVAHVLFLFLVYILIFYHLLKINKLM